MEISRKVISDILKTLPIGLYAGRRVSLELDDVEETSYYSPGEDKIVISTKIITEGLNNIKKLPENFSIETAVRTMLYHEVSHVILTPYGAVVDQVTNIFEDERIETLLRGYYLDTNFKQNVYNICKDLYEKNPENADEEFFQTVRFRKGKKKFVDRVYSIIERYKDMDSSSDDEKDNDIVWDYRYEIRQLYNEIAQQYDYNSSNNPPNIGNGNEIIDTDIKDLIDEENNIAEQRHNKDAAERGQKKSDDSSDNNSNALGDNADSNGTEKDNCTENDESECSTVNETNDNTDDSGKGVTLGSVKNLSDVFEKLQEIYHDERFYQTAQQVVASFNKKNNSGNGITAYSGVFNPRNVARKDYKYFDKPVSVNGNNKFGSFHLNLFIDNSGSFSSSKDAVNAILADLERIERRYKNFTFDLIKCGSNMVEAKVRKIDANEGTWLDDRAVDVFNKHQRKRNTLIHNIVLYDGRCDIARRAEIKDFKFMDFKNVTMILENSNVLNVERVYNANIIWQNDNYSEKLSETISKVFAKAFS